MAASTGKKSQLVSEDESNIGPAKSENQNDDEVIPGYTDVNKFSQDSLQSCLHAIKNSNNLPSGQEYDYYSSYSAFLSVMDQQGERLLNLMNGILRQQNLKVGQLKNLGVLELEEKFDILVDANDVILERVSNMLDEAEGLRKTEQQLVIASLTPKPNINTSWNQRSVAIPKISATSSYRLLSARNILRPQLKFCDKIDNSNRPFIPCIKVKPNALKCLPVELIQAQKEESNKIYAEFAHPYEYELKHFQPLPEQVTIVEPQLPLPLAETHLKFIDTLEDLQKLCELLKKEKEFSVDLEHHSYRSFQGLTCLMQLSTRDTDFLIDTLELRSEMHILNDVFTDPKIVKVFHGADMDIEWLQRDFGLYVVNMFDTGQAARVLHFARFSLAFLLKHFCQLEIDKQFQLADWRIRPLPQELVNYAREDTHYLLYIYDRMRNELIEQGNEQNNLLLHAIQKSRVVCERKYVKQLFHDDDYQALYRKSKKTFNYSQLTALKNMYAWRDKIARVEDESLGYVLPNHMMLHIAEVLPREKQGILALCTPIPPIVRQQLIELHEIVFRAKENPVVKSVVPETPVRNEPNKTVLYNPENLLNCPHDTSHIQDQDLVGECLLNEVSSDVSSKPPAASESDVRWKKKPDICLFAMNSEVGKHDKPNNAEISNILQMFISPFQRYRLVKPKLLPNGQLNPAELVAFDNERVQNIFSHWVTLSQAALQKQDSSSVLPSDKLSSTPGEVTGKEQQLLDLPDVKADEKEVLPLNRLFPPKKTKKNKRKLDDDFFKAGPIDNDELPRKKSPKTNKEPFKAFDYSKADYSVFQDTKGNKSKADQPFNPDVKKKEHKVGDKMMKKKAIDNSKRMTFSKKNPASDLQWPKR